MAACLIHISILIYYFHALWCALILCFLEMCLEICVWQQKAVCHLQFCDFLSQKGVMIVYGYFIGVSISRDLLTF